MPSPKKVGLSIRDCLFSLLCSRTCKRRGGAGGPGPGAGGLGAGGRGEGVALAPHERQLLGLISILVFTRTSQTLAQAHIIGRLKRGAYLQGELEPYIIGSLKRGATSSPFILSLLSAAVKAKDLMS